MYAPALPLPIDPLLPDYVRASGGVRLRLGRIGDRTMRLEVAESGGYRARFPTSHDGRCEAVLINTAGGMAGGDRARTEIALDAGAQAVVTTQAAEKIYRSQGSDTQVDTEITVASGAELAWLPQETILFSGARLARSLNVDLAASSSFVACETLYFGRAAMGEVLLHGSLHDRWRIRREGRLVFAEDLRLDGAIETTLRRKAVGQGARAVSTVLATAPEATGWLDEIRAFLIEDPAFSRVEAAAGAHEGFLLIRLLGGDAQALRRALVMLLRQVTGRALPRTWSI
ncbi:urease accessory protein UreD [Bosea sp. (in: a-proteobacteria)]|uniref:urease accessory protein UreD n=1 Tax=Bosea sp. (in: a-proteobacteria) TaxID=1871050 RepID=UPI002FCCA0FD